MRPKQPRRRPAIRSNSPSGVVGRPALRLLDRLPGNTVLGWSELVLGLLITLLAVVLHAIFVYGVGGLWRDEIQIVNIGLMPTFAEVWKWIEIDTFPLLWPMTLRTWSMLGLASSDLGLRLLGLAVGLGIVGLLWWFARQFQRGVPLFSLVLFALCPTVFTFGDSLRGYGMGALTMVAMVGAVWRAVEAPTRRRIGIALVAALLAVQCMYFNALTLLALGIGGLAVSIRRRSWKPVLIVIGIGLVAALSLLPYIDPISRQSRWNAISKSPTDLAGLFGQCKEAATSYGGFMIWVWLAFLAVSLAACGYRLFVRRAEELPGSKDAAAFLGAVLLFGPIFQFAFILAAGVPSRPWYYIALLGLVGMAGDAALGLLLGTNRLGRSLRLTVIALLVAAVIPGAWQGAFVRFTNVDLIAAELEKTATSQDLILIAPWWPGVTFQRYYHGPAPWTTLPDLGELRVQRFDALKEKMAETAPIQPVLEKIAQTLSSGHRLYLVGGLQFQQPPFRVPPIPEGPMSEAVYLEAWSRQTGNLLRVHALRLDQISIPAPSRIPWYENLGLSRIEGWH